MSHVNGHKFDYFKWESNHIWFELKIEYHTCQWVVEWLDIGSRLIKYK